MKTELIRIDKNVCIASPWPCIYLEDEKILLMSDTHLGLEDQRERLGISIPGSILQDILNLALTPVKDLCCRKIILLGDIKHEFGKPSEAEWYSVKRFIKALRDIECEPEIVRGNHDNYIIYVLKSMNVTFHDPSLKIGDYYLTHGHLDLEDDFGNAKYVFMGHEHPSVTVKDDVGAKHRFKAFLTGVINGRRITILPSASPLSYGNPVNEIDKNDLMVPILRRHGIEDFIPYLIEIGSMVKKFPMMKYL